LPLARKRKRRIVPLAEGERLLVERAMGIGMAQSRPRMLRMIGIRVGTTIGRGKGAGADGQRLEGGPPSEGFSFDLEKAWCTQKSMIYGKLDRASYQWSLSYFWWQIGG
jgi:hypothetical protein